MDNSQLLENAYVYGVYINEELVYIGKTYQPLQDRIDAHIQRCHNAQLKEALLNNHYTFKILYESHNSITSDTLNNIEEALISTNQPKYNKCGVTMPYNHSSHSVVFSGGGLATQLASKHYYSDEDIQQVLAQNAQIACAYICLKDEYATTFFQPSFAQLTQKEQNECIEYLFGKTNKFNTMAHHGERGFRQTSYCVKEDNGLIRFPTVQEKIKGIKKSWLQPCHIVFLFNTEQDYDKAAQKFTESKPTNQDDWFVYCMEQERWAEARLNFKDGVFKYYPLEIATPTGEDLKHSYFYIDTWQTSLGK